MADRLLRRRAAAPSIGPTAWRHGIPIGGFAKECPLSRELTLELYCIASKQPGNDLYRFLGVDRNPDNLPTCHWLRPLFENNSVRITRIRDTSSATHEKITVDMTHSRANTWAAACKLQVPSCCGFVSFERKARHPQSLGLVRSNRSLNRRRHMRWCIAIVRLVGDGRYLACNLRYWIEISGQHGLHCLQADSRRPVTHPAWHQSIWSLCLPGRDSAQRESCLPDLCLSRS